MEASAACESTRLRWGIVGTGVIASQFAEDLRAQVRACPQRDALPRASRPARRALPSAHTTSRRNSLGCASPARMRD
jgi:hypothetical protein